MGKKIRTPKCILGAVVVALFLTVTWSTTAARLSTTTNSPALEAGAASLEPASPGAGGAIVIASAPNVSLEALPSPGVTASALSTFAPQKASLEQIRNGSATSPTDPGDWVNGNAGASTAHYREGYSIPYRMVLTGLAIGPHELQIEWDLRHSGKNAIDYITHFDRLNSPSHQAVFAHPVEDIDPTIGIAGLGVASTANGEIPAPSSAGSTVTNQPTLSFDALPAGERVMTIYNGTFSGVGALSYLSQGSLTDAQSSTRLKILFNATESTVVIAWGGHIATQTDWGAGNSASAVSGSPYHTRLVSLDGAGGNQDRSLSAAAVQVDCATCSVNSVTSPVQCGTANTHTSTIVEGSGVCDNPVHSWTIEGNGVIEGATNGSSVSVRAGAVCNGSYTITDTITCSGCTGGTTITCSKTVSVVDTTAPVITCPPNAMVECGGSTLPAATGTATAIDNCSTLGVGFTDAVTPGCGATRVIMRTWTATDACGNASSCVQTITVVDTTPPTIDDVPDATVECFTGSTDPSVTGSATGSDICGSVTISYLDGPMSDGCGNTGSFVRTWTATDSCGLTANSQQNITIVDTTPPTISDVPDAEVECTGSTEPTATGSATGADTCGNVTISHEDGATSDACGNTGSFVRTWTATDECGNTATSTQTIAIVDTTPPTISDVPDAIVECPGSTDPSATGEPTGSDTCGDVTIEKNDGPMSDTCGNTGSFVRTWTATDDCGNTATSEQTITIVDTTAPIITCPPDATVTCFADVPDPATTLAELEAQGGTASDTCGNVSISSSDEPFDQSTCGDECGGKIMRMYTATDDCGNTSVVCTQIITYGTPGSAQSPLQVIVASLLKSGDLVVGVSGRRSLTIPGGLNAKSSALCIVSRLSASGSASALPDFGDGRLDPATCQTSPPLDLQSDGTWSNMALSQTISLALNLRLNEQQQQLIKRSQASALRAGQRPDAGFELGNLVLPSLLWTQGVRPGPDGLTGTSDDELDSSSARMQIMVPASVLNALGSGATVSDLLRLANAALAGDSVGDVSLADITAAVDAINRSFDFGKRRPVASQPTPGR